MDLSKACIINGAVGSWYPQGQKRLMNSLVYYGYAGQVLRIVFEPKDIPVMDGIYDPVCPYTIKAHLLKRAMEMGYRQILWLDCSIWAIQNPNPFFDVIKERGAYLMTSGYNARQTTSDKCADIFGYTRTELEAIPELWSCIFGFDLDNPIAERIALDFIEAAKQGAFHGSRLHDNQSADPQFLFHRQDQSALTLAWAKNDHQREIVLHQPNKHLIQQTQQAITGITNETYFLMRGL